MFANHGERNETQSAGHAETERFMSSSSMQQSEVVINVNNWGYRMVFFCAVGLSRYYHVVVRDIEQDVGE